MADRLGDGRRLFFGMTFPDARSLQAARLGPLLVVMNAGSGQQDAGDAQQVMARVFEQAGREFESALLVPADADKAEVA